MKKINKEKLLAGDPREFNQMIVNSAIQSANQWNNDEFQRETNARNDGRPYIATYKSYEDFLKNELR